jgi:hypothetical protein
MPSVYEYHYRIFSIPLVTEVHDLSLSGRLSVGALVWILKCLCMEEVDVTKHHQNLGLQQLDIQIIVCLVHGKDCNLAKRLLVCWQT